VSGPPPSLDLLLAKARYAREAGATEPEITDPTRRRRPPLPAAGDGATSAPRQEGGAITVEMGRNFSILVITGPNTGQDGVPQDHRSTRRHDPGRHPHPGGAGERGAGLDAIYSDIGDEQSIEQTLSTFSWHIGNIVPHHQ